MPLSILRVENLEEKRDRDGFEKISTRRSTESESAVATNTSSFEMNDFKLPQNFPQDLLLICDLIGVPTDSDAPPLSPRIPVVVQTDDDIDSSDSEIASEDEIEAELIPVNYADNLQGHKAMHVLLSSPSATLTDSIVQYHQTLILIQIQIQSLSLA